MYETFLRGGCSAPYEADRGSEGLAAAIALHLEHPGQEAVARANARGFAVRENSYAAFGHALARVYDVALP